MAISTVIAIYFIIWWVVLFAVLPWGVHSQQESGEVAPGTDPGAPAVHRDLAQADLDHRDRGVVFGILYGGLQGRPDPVRIPEADFQSAAFLKRQADRKRVDNKKRAGHDALLVALVKSLSPLFVRVMLEAAAFSAPRTCSSQDLDRTLGAGF